MWKLGIALCLSPENDMSQIMGTTTMKVLTGIAVRIVLH
jgi:hypothetical protein